MIEVGVQSSGCIGYLKSSTVLKKKIHLDNPKNLNISVLSYLIYKEKNNGSKIF